MVKIIIAKMVFILTIAILALCSVPLSNIPDVWPEPIELVRPSYPSEALEKKKEGITILKIFVNAEGKVDSVMVLKSSGNILLDESAKKAVLESKFRPAEINNKPIGMWIILPYQFTIIDKQLYKKKGGINDKHKIQK